VSLIGGVAIALDDDKDGDKRYEDGAAFVASSMLISDTGKGACRWNYDSATVCLYHRCHDRNAVAL